MTHHPLHYRRVLVLLAVLAAVVGVARSDALHHALLEILGVAGTLIAEHPRLGMLLFLVLAGLSAMLSFFSASALIPVGVYAWGPSRTALLLLAGGTIGGTAAYWIAYSLGRKIVNRLLPETPLRKYETFLRKEASWRTILMFRIALQSEIPSYLLGLVRYPFKRYLPMILLGELPYVIVMVFLGESFLERNSFMFVVVLVIGMLLTLFAWRALQRELQKTPT